MAVTDWLPSERETAITSVICHFRSYKTKTLQYLLFWRSTLGFPSKKKHLLGGSLKTTRELGFIIQPCRSLLKCLISMCMTKIGNQNVSYNFYLGDKSNLIHESWNIFQLKLQIDPMEHVIGDCWDTYFLIFNHTSVKNNRKPLERFPSAVCRANDGFVPVYIGSDSSLKLLSNLDLLQICHRGSRDILYLTV